MLWWPHIGPSPDDVMTVSCIVMSWPFWPKWDDCFIPTRALLHCAPLPSLLSLTITLSPPPPNPAARYRSATDAPFLDGPPRGGLGLRRSLRTCNLRYMDLTNNERTSIHASIKRKKKRKGCSVSNFKDMQNVLYPKVTLG